MYGLALLLASLAIPAAPPADLVLFNGTIYTANANDDIVPAVAVRRGRITAVGSDELMLRFVGAKTERIDLGGAFVVPGFNDTHVHLASAARFHEFNIMRTATQDDLVERVRKATVRLPAGEWITGGFWGAYDQWAPDTAGGESRPRFTPDMRLVEAVSKRHPIFLERFDRGEFAVNGAALAAAGLDPDTPVEGIEFVRDEAGEPTGILRGFRAWQLFQQVIPGERSRERRLRQTRNALDLIRRAGVTSISDMSDETQLEIYKELRDAGELTVRVDFRPPLDRWATVSGREHGVTSADEWLRVGAVKGHIDGIMGTSTARFLEPYANDPTNRGSWRPLMVDDTGAFVEGRFLQYMLDADAAGVQLSVHAIGDEANHLLLDYLEDLGRRNGPRDRRFRLVHAQVVAPGDFARLGADRVVAEVQPYHLSDDMRWMEERIGAERCRGAYAFRSIQDSGATLCFGSDWPGTSAAEYPIDPLLGLHAAVTRQTVSGEPAGGWFPEQRLTMKEALRAYTINGAYATFENQYKGSIEVGRHADMTVLTRNLLEIDPSEILGTEIAGTIVGGRIVYDSRTER